MNMNPIFLSDHGKMLADLYVLYCNKTLGTTEKRFKRDIILTLDAKEGPKREGILKTLKNNRYLTYCFDNTRNEYRIVLTENGYHLGGSLASARHRY